MPKNRKGRLNFAQGGFDPYVPDEVRSNPGGNNNEDSPFMAHHCSACNPCGLNQHCFHTYPRHYAIDYDWCNIDGTLKEYPVGRCSYLPRDFL